MATDGVKIIDGDLARDTYMAIMELYDNDASIDLIQKQVPFIKTNFGSDTAFYNEIFITSYALAFWEIGEITQEILSEVRSVIDLKAGVRVWTEEIDEKEGKKRQRELEKFWLKINSPNNKIRKRKKYRIVKNLYFEPDDLVTFKLSDGSYYAMICAKITQQRGLTTYDFVATTYKSDEKPNQKNILNYFIAGRRIGSGLSPKQTLIKQAYVDKIWSYCKPATNFFFGLSYHLVTHKDMINFKDRFEKVGQLKLIESFKRDGSYGYKDSFDRFEEIFLDLDNHMKIFREEKFPVTLICEL